MFKSPSFVASASSFTQGISREIDLELDNLEAGNYLAFVEIETKYGPAEFCITTYGLSPVRFGENEASHYDRVAFLSDIFTS